MKLEHLGEIDSTNDEVRRRAENGEIGPIWISAKSQTKGRGRRGREWESKDGNLYTTGLYTLAIGAKQAANLSFVAALAVRNTIAHYLPNRMVKLKWPNDVLVDDKKIAGILLESWLSHGEIKIAIGIGINIVAAPQDPNINACTIQEFLPSKMPAPSREDVLELLASSFESYLGLWREQGFERIRLDWISHAIGLGEQVVVRLHDSEKVGIFKDINSSGELVLGHEDKSFELISAGDVFFPHLK